jgi:hypothetical protein
MAYTIVDWYVKEVNNGNISTRGALTNKNTMLKEFQRIAKEDETKKVRHALRTIKNNGKNIWDVVSSDSQMSLNDYYINSNSDWLQARLKKVDSAKDKNDIGVLKSEIDSVADEFGSDYVDDIKKAITEKLKQFERIELSEQRTETIGRREIGERGSIEAEIHRKITAEINKAKTLAQLEKIDITKAITTQSEELLAKLLDEKIALLEESEE